MIVVGDAIEQLRATPSDSIDLIVTDPPYNVGYKYSSYKDNLSLHEYTSWQQEVVDECYRVLKPGGSLFYLNYPEFNSLMWCYLLSDFKANDLTPQDLIAWVYNTHTSGNPLRKSFRTWIWASKGEPKLNNFYGEYKNPTDKRVAKLIEGGRKPKEYDWWHFEQVKNVSREKTAHPCQIPEVMIRKIIEATTEEGDTVLDPFVGSGTTVVVAESIKRIGIGFDIDGQYAAIAEQRLAV